MANDMNAEFTPEEAKLIWTALRYSEPPRFGDGPDTHREAVKVLADELYRIGVFQRPAHPSDAGAASGASA